MSNDGKLYKGELLHTSPVGGLRHIDDPYTLANTEFAVWQYVTWVEDAAVGDTEPSIGGVQSYKRVTVVVRWKFPVQSGLKHTVVDSTIVTDGTIDPPTPSPTPTPTPTPSTSPTPTPSAASTLGEGVPIGNADQLRPAESKCPGTDVPSLQRMTVLSGSGTERGYLTSTSVEIRFEKVDDGGDCFPIRVFMKNVADPFSSTDGCTKASGYDINNPVRTVNNDAEGTFNVLWTIPSGDGQKSLCAVAENDTKRPSVAWAVTVVLDQTRPTVPANFAESNCTIDPQAGTRTVTFTYAASSDSNLMGYRLYKSVDTSEFILASQSNSTTISHTDQRHWTSLRYLLRAYDKAGNESASTATLSYAKNKC